ncbi:hypothetical protein CK203_116796 [Vitis vinifera]|uniref:Uncharacterized protein n=1 Tax=Vitis vinifera TaxID=29760 RepID=A0A438CA68_VITVI|nr:hypothetical protein CK203_116796 [Vitis vinifera]
MEDFVGEQQKINSHLNEKIDNMESSINVRMEEVYNDLSLRIEKVQDSIENLTNLDIARGEKEASSSTHHKPPRNQCKKIKESVEDRHFGIHFSREEKRNEFPWTKWEGCNFVWDPGGIQHEVGVYDAYKKSKWSDSYMVRKEAFLMTVMTATFGALPKVHFMYTICRFKAWEVRSPWLQTVCDLDLNEEVMAI